MLKRVQYETQEERQELMDANAELILIQEDNITEGNFLTFSDTDEFMYKDIPVGKIEDLEARQDDLEMTIAEMMGL